MLAKPGPLEHIRFMTKHPHIGIRVLFIEQDDGGWIGQCLEYDIAAQAKTFNELKHEFERVLMAYLMLDDQSETDLLGQLGKAPQKFWEMYQNSEENELSLGKQLVRPSNDHHPAMPKRHVRIAEPAHV
jgi:hypothetical protein